VSDKPTPPSITLTTQLTAQLDQFGKAQLTEVSTRDLRASTVHLILATAFFTGAAIGMAKLSDTPRKVYLRVLRIFLEKRFGLNADHATGLVESNARLYKRFVLIELIYNAGWLSASEWCKHPDTPNDELKLLLTKYKDLSMTGLNIEGTKQKATAPADIEHSVAVEKPLLVATTPTRSRRNTLLVLLIVLFASIGYLVFYTDHLSSLLPVLKPALQSALESLFQFIEPYIQPLTNAISNL